MPRLLSVSLIMFTVFWTASRAGAGPVLERVKARGAVRCGSVERPGLAEPDGKGGFVFWAGLEVDICRAIAAAVLGSPDRIEYHTYETPKQFDAIRNRQDDVFFLTGTEINEQGLAGKIVPGPAVFLESHAVMVPSGMAAQHLGDLAGDSICFLSGSRVERSLNSYFDSLHKSWLRIPFSEEGEMNDAYNVQRCHGIAGEVTTLAAARLASGVNRISSRILPESLSVFPVIAAAGPEDAGWSAVVAWTVITLTSAERPGTAWYAGGAGAMPVTAPELGLDAEWQKRVLAAVGSYGDIFERNVGKGSRFGLPRGLNANELNGGLLLAPFLE